MAVLFLAKVRVFLPQEASSEDLLLLIPCTASHLLCKNFAK